MEQEGPPPHSRLQGVLEYLTIIGAAMAGMAHARPWIAVPLAAAVLLWFLDFLDPWGNRIEIVSYQNIQFSKAPNVLRGMGLSHLSKNPDAIKELTEKNMAPG